MSNRSSAIQYTIRGIPPDVDRLLRQKAAAARQSVNQVVIGELARATAGTVKKSDFTQFVGSWEADPAFDEALASQRTIDPAKWT